MEDWTPPEEWTPEDAAEAALHYAEGGPVAAAGDWLRASRDRDFPTLWRLTDPNLRLVIAQDWIWANLEIRNRFFAGIADPEEREAFAQHLARDVVTTDDPFKLGELFIAMMTDKFQEIGYDPETWGAASRPRLIAPDYELVLFVDTGGEALTFDGPTLINVDISLLMHSTDRGWLVAGFTERVPQPGWPPTDSGLDQPAE